MSGDSFFQKVTTRVDRERVYTLMVEHGTEVLIVNEKKEQSTYKPKFLSGSKLYLKAQSAVGSVTKGINIISFSLGAEKYFLKGQLTEERGDDVSLDIHTDLYKLQRRSSFRLNIPQGYQARIEIKQRNGQVSREKHDLVDLSGGGFAFELPAGHEPAFKSGEKIEGRLVVGPDFTADVRCLVKHSRMVGSRGSGLCRVGLEFEGLGSSVQNDIINLVMNLHRNMFSKFKLGSR